MIVCSRTYASEFRANCKHSLGFGTEGIMWYSFNKKDKTEKILLQERVVLGKCVVSLNCRRNKVGCGRGRRYASSQNAPRPFLLLFWFEFTGNRMARWRAYSELVINPWKPPTRGLLWEIASIMTPIFICFLHCLILKIVYGLLFAEGSTIIILNRIAPDPGL